MPRNRANHVDVRPPAVVYLTGPRGRKGALDHIVRQQGCRLVTVTDPGGLEQALAGSGPAPVAVLVDLDHVPLDNRTLCRLAQTHPQVGFMGISRRLFHPGLEEAIGRCLFACLRKPVDPDELGFLLGCLVHRATNGGTDGRGPPGRAP